MTAGLNDLAELYTDQSRYAEGELLLQRVLTILADTGKAEELVMADSLHRLAEIRRLQGRYAEAEPLFQQARTIREQALGAEHPAVADSLQYLAQLSRDQGACTSCVRIIHLDLSQAARFGQTGRS